jgi:hypothetical protein
VLTLSCFHFNIVLYTMGWNTSNLTCKYITIAFSFLALFYIIRHKGGGGGGDTRRCFVFWCTWKIVKSNYQLCCVCVHGTTQLPLDAFFEIWYLSIFLNMSRKFRFHYNLTRVAGNLHTHQYTILIVSCWSLLRFWNFSDKSCKENENTHFMYSNFLLKIVSSMR